LRLVGYPRVSTRGQVKTGASIPYQDREIRAWARRDGHRIVGMFPEEGRSGALDLEDRAALTAAIDMIATGKGEGLVCYSLDRLAREITVQEAILAKVWEEAGGRVFTTDQGEVLRDDPDDPMRTAMRKMAGVTTGPGPGGVVRHPRRAATTPQGCIIPTDLPGASRYPT
jgi:DNA invertase Pin-like site-specific DNA recombinase